MTTILIQSENRCQMGGSAARGHLGDEDGDHDRDDGQPHQPLRTGEPRPGQGEDPGQHQR